MPALRLKMRFAPLFVQDCKECECDIGEWDGRFLLSRPRQLCELYNRAYHYANGHVDLADAGLVGSAKAVIAKFEANPLMRALAISEERGRGFDAAIWILQEAILKHLGGVE